MNSLQTIQKTFRVFHILTKVAMILAFVGSGLLLIGLTFGIDILKNGAVISGGMETLYDLTSSDSVYKMICTLSVEFVLTLTDAILLTYAYKYLSQEQKDGTPFSEKGANMIKRLGIKLIVLPFVASIIAAVIYVSFGIDQIDSVDFSNGRSTAMGIALILVSLILRYGTELEQKNKTQDVMLYK